MHIPNSLSRECVCGWACPHASPSAEPCAPLASDKPRFPSRSPDGLCLDQAPTEHPSLFVCCPWLTSKPFLVEPADFRNIGLCPTCVINAPTASTLVGSFAVGSASRASRA